MCWYMWLILLLDPVSTLFVSICDSSYPEQNVFNIIFRVCFHLVSVVLVGHTAGLQPSFFGRLNRFRLVDGKPALMKHSGCKTSNPVTSVTFSSLYELNTLWLIEKDSNQELIRPWYWPWKTHFLCVMSVLICFRLNRESFWVHISPWQLCNETLSCVNKSAGRLRFYSKPVCVCVVADTGLPWQPTPDTWDAPVCYWVSSVMRRVYLCVLKGDYRGEKLVSCLVR